MPYGTGSLLVKDPGALRRSHSVSAHYMPGMQDDPDSVDFCEISPELSRNFRGLEVWLAVELCGLAAFRKALDEKLDLAREAADAVRAIPDMTIVAEPELSLFAFRLAPPGASVEEANRLNRELMARVNARQRVLLTGTLLGDVFALRMCILNFRTHADRIRMALEDLRAAAREVGGNNPGPKRISRCQVTMRRRDFLALTLPVLAGAGVLAAIGSAGPEKSPAQKGSAMPDTAAAADRVVKTDAEWKKLLTPEQYLRHAEEGHRARVHGPELGQPREGHVPVRVLRPAALLLRHEVRLGHRLAELLAAARAEFREDGGGPELLLRAHGGDVPPLRRPPRPRLRRRPEAHGPALLHERDCHEVRPGEVTSRPLHVPSARSSRKRARDERVLLDGPPADEVLLDDPLEDGRVARAVPHSLGIDDGDGAAGADPQAVRLVPLHAAARREAELLQARLQVGPRGVRALPLGALRLRLVAAQEDVPPRLGNSDASRDLRELLRRLVPVPAVHDVSRL